MFLFVGCQNDRITIKAKSHITIKKNKHMATEAADAKEKMKVLQMAIDKIEKTYGKGTIMRMGDEAIEKI
jgi:hypothetical protein